MLKKSSNLSLKSFGVSLRACSSGSLALVSLMNCEYFSTEILARRSANSKPNWDWTLVCQMYVGNAFSVLAVFTKSGKTLSGITEFCVAEHCCWSLHENFAVVSLIGGSAGCGSSHWMLEKGSYQRNLEPTKFVILRILGPNFVQIWQFWCRWKAGDEIYPNLAKLNWRDIHNLPKSKIWV